MEKRRSERKDVHISVKLIVGGESYDAFIENVSSGGVGLTIMLTPEEMVDRIVTKAILKLEFQTGTAKEITLQCRIIWVKMSPDKNVGITYIIGSEILDPPAEYIEFLKNL